MELEASLELRGLQYEMAEYHLERGEGFEPVQMVIFNYSHYEMEGAVVDLAVAFPKIKLIKIYDILNIDRDHERKLEKELEACQAAIGWKALQRSYLRRMSS